MPPSLDNDHRSDNSHRDASYTISLEIEGTNIDKYPAKQHARRVASQLGVKGGLIYLLGQQNHLIEDSDQDRPFRQKRYFFYLSGVSEPDCHLTYDIRTDTLTLYVPDFDLKDAIWMGPTLDRDEAEMNYDIDMAQYHSCLDSDLSKWQKRDGKDYPMYILHQDHTPKTASSHLSFDHDSLLPAMTACRVIKDDHEIQLVKRANDVSAAAHTAILHSIREMKNEAEIHGLFLNTCISNGARNQAYAIIAASGSNAATLHYSKNDEPLEGRQLVLLDAGAEWDCYASDVTRTFPMSGHWPSEEARNIYSVVERMQEACIKPIREGVRFRDLHGLAHSIAIRELLTLGILKGGSVEEVGVSGVSSVFFPHGLGHHMGLEVHDVSPEKIMAANSSERQHNHNHALSFSSELLSPCTTSAPALKAGMIVTVEPGIYFSKLALDNARSHKMFKYIDMDVVERYMPVGGVRIEDDILVTKDGYRNLTTAAKGEAMLDIIGCRNNSK